jgi:hypothetical protein
MSAEICPNITEGNGGLRGGDALFIFFDEWQAPECPGISLPCGNNGVNKLCDYFGFRSEILSERPLLRWTRETGKSRVQIKSDRLVMGAVTRLAGWAPAKVPDFPGQAAGRRSSLGKVVSMPGMLTGLACRPRLRVHAAHHRHLHRVSCLQANG